MFHTYLKSEVADVYIATFAVAAREVGNRKWWWTVWWRKERLSTIRRVNINVHFMIVLIQFLP